MNIKFAKVEVLLPEEYIETLRSRLSDIGVLTVGKYDHVIPYSLVKGSWRPLEESKPFNGSIGELCFGTEYENSRHLSPSDLKVGVSRVSPSKDA